MKFCGTQSITLKDGSPQRNQIEYLRKLERLASDRVFPDFYLIKMRLKWLAHTRPDGLPQDFSAGQSNQRLIRVKKNQD